MSTAELVMRFYDRLWNQWDDSAVDDTLAPGLSFRGSTGQHTVGRDGWRGFRDQYRAAAPDFHTDVLDLITTDNRAAVGLQFTGTHRGPLLGIPATGRRFTYHGAGLFTTADGLLTDIWIVGDVDELRRQLIGPAIGQ